MYYLNKLRSELSYNQDTGIFVRCSTAKEIGYIHHGYVVVFFAGKQHQAHRLAWLYVYGEWPKGVIDHINGIKNDNRICNLRDVSRQENAANSQHHRGIRLLPDNRIEVSIRIDGKIKKFGYFDSIASAHQYRNQILAGLNGADCTRDVRWNSLTQARLREILHYEPETGDFFWLTNRGGTARAGTLAGWKRSDGYVRINVDCKLHYAHRLAWLYIYGECPSKEVDHINGDPSDNRISNLRLATHSQNLANQKTRADNKAGFKGVTLLADGTYIAAVQRAGQKVVAGYFKDPQHASKAYVSAAKEIYGKFARGS